jgi:hypothetical protein
MFLSAQNLLIFSFVSDAWGLIMNVRFFFHDLAFVKLVNTDQR